MHVQCRSPVFWRLTLVNDSVLPTCLRFFYGATSRKKRENKVSPMLRCSTPEPISFFLSVIFRAEDNERGARIAVLVRLYLPPLVDIFNKITRRKAICTYKNIILSRSIGPIYNMYRSCTFIICIDKILRVTSASFVSFFLFFLFFFFFFFWYVFRTSHFSPWPGRSRSTTLVVLVPCLECEEKHDQRSHDDCIAIKRPVYEFSFSFAFERS